MAGLPLYPTEARILAKHVVSVKPNAKVGILYQNDDFGRDSWGRSSRCWRMPAAPPR